MRTSLQFSCFLYCRGTEHNFRVFLYLVLNVNCLIDTISLSLHEQDVINLKKFMTCKRIVL